MFRRKSVKIYCTGMLIEPFGIEKLNIVLIARHLQQTTAFDIFEIVGISKYCFHMPFLSHKVSNWNIQGSGNRSLPVAVFHYQMTHVLTPHIRTYKQYQV